MRSNLSRWTCLLAVAALAAACNSDSSYSPTSPILPTPPAPVPALAGPIFSGSITIQGARIVGARGARDCFVDALDRDAGRVWDLSLRLPPEAENAWNGDYATSLFRSPDTGGTCPLTYQVHGDIWHLDLYPYCDAISYSDSEYGLGCTPSDTSVTLSEMTLPPAGFANGYIAGPGTITVRRWATPPLSDVSIAVNFDLRRVGQ